MPGVSIHFDPLGSTHTAVDGSYSLDVANGTALTIRASLSSGPQGGVTTADAVAILQYLVGLRSLNALGVLAADTNGSSNVSTADAVAILRYLVGLIPTLPVATKCGSWWAFAPEATVASGQTLIWPDVSGSECELGSIVFAPLSGPVTGQDFVGVLFGDVNASWRSASAPAESQPNLVTLGRVRALTRARGRVYRAPLLLMGSPPVHGLEIKIAVPAEAVRRARFRLVHPAPGTLQAQHYSGEELRVAVASAKPLQRGLLGWVVLLSDSPTLSSRTLHLREARGFVPD